LTSPRDWPEDGTGEGLAAKMRKSMQAELGQWITEGTEYPDDQPERGV